MLGESFPYVAYTQSNPTAVRSGPGEAFYVTDELQAGQAVEVYRLKGDWCAVRPPEGSFSYVAAEAVQPARRASLLRVTVQDTATRVGTRLSNAHNVAYVTLDEGEILQAVGPRITLGGKSWYKIAPPSGEFRWMHRDDLKREKLELADKAAPRELELTADAQPLPGPTSEPEETGSGVQPAAHAKTEIPLQKLGEQGSMETFPIPTEEEDEQVAQVAAEEPEETPTETETSSAWKAVDTSDQPPPPPKPPFEADGAAHQLAVLNLQLSRTVLRPMGQWQLATLRDEVEQIARAATDPSVQEQAAPLMRRITEFDRLEQRHLEITKSEGDIPRDEAAAPAAQFTGQGWLIPVITSRADLPHFALTDDHGKILHFVSSPPGTESAALRPQACRDRRNAGGKFEHETLARRRRPRRPARPA